MGNKPYQMTGTPEVGGGTRILEPTEVFELMMDPKMREAIDIIEKAEGKPREATLMAFNALKHNREVDMHVQEQKRAIDLYTAKKEGILER